MLLSKTGNVLLNSRPSLTNGPIDIYNFKFNLDQNNNLKVARLILILTLLQMVSIEQAAMKGTSPINPHILNSSKCLLADIKQPIINTHHARAK